MKKRMPALLAACALALAACAAGTAEASPDRTDLTATQAAFPVPTLPDLTVGNSQSQESLSEKFAFASQSEYCLDFTGDWDNVTDPDYRDALQTLFDTVYPRIYARFAVDSDPKTITLHADSTYTGTAYSSGSKIVVGVDYINANPDDIGFLAHELTHCVQNYGSSLNYGGDAWWTENLANYSRFRYFQWADVRYVQVWSPEDTSVQDWGYLPYGSCSWFFAYMDTKHPTQTDASGALSYGLVDSINLLIKSNTGSQLDDDPYDTATPINQLVRRITGFDCIESLRLQYVSELRSGSWTFEGFRDYPDNFLTEDLPGVADPEYPMMVQAVHGGNTAPAETAFTTGENLCAGATVCAVSGQVNDRERAELLIDGDPTTKWCSTAGTAVNQRYHLDGTRQWILLDLGEETEFNTYTILNTQTREPAYGNMTEWELLISHDGESWISVDYQPACSLSSASFRIGDRTARYVLLRIYDPDDSQAGTIRLYEFQLYRR